MKIPMAFPMAFPSFHQRLVSTRAAAISAVQHIGTALVRIRDLGTPALRGEGPSGEKGSPESTVEHLLPSGELT
jgi:hypothetical protein